MSQLALSADLLWSSHPQTLRPSLQAAVPSAWAILAKPFPTGILIRHSGLRSNGPGDVFLRRLIGRTFSTLAPDTLSSTHCLTSLLPLHFSPHSLLMLDEEGLPGGSVVKNPPADAEDMGLLPSLGRSHVLRSNQGRVPQLLAWALESWRLRLGAAALRNGRAEGGRGRTEGEK